MEKSSLYGGQLSRQKETLTEPDWACDIFQTQPSAAGAASKQTAIKRNTCSNARPNVREFHVNVDRGGEASDILFSPVYSWR